MTMTNRRNRLIYRLWAPVYDAVLGRLFLPGRKRALALLDLQPGERVLLVGCGTGADFPLLPERVEAVGLDLSREMLARAHSRLPLPGRTITLMEADAQVRQFDEGTFDAVILNLILSVVPDGRACLHSAVAALRPGGRGVVFDKFAPEGAHLSPLRVLLNWFSSLLGTDITRRFKEMIGGSGLEIIQEEPGILGGMYRVILFKRVQDLRGRLKT